ncbi:MAG: sulfatase-like hydrolase/transferase [Deltaproteobacteria bacterium]|nr:sulfatase-like hydrolase/transferase [Deltaproteobacteria bacterium]
MLGLPLAVSVGSRWFMFRALSRAPVGAREFCGLFLAGACKDLLPLALLLALQQAALFAGFLTPAALLAGLAAGLGVLVVLLNILDAGVYYNTRQRVFPLFLKELRPRNIAVALSVRQKAALGGILPLLAGYAACFFLPRPVAALPPAVPAVLLALAILLGLLALAFGRLEFSAASYLKARPSTPYMDIHRQFSGKLAAIGASSPANFAACLRNRLGRPQRLLQAADYSRSEQRSLERLGLLGGGRYSERPPSPVRYKRIILVCLESVSQLMLPFYNRNLDPAITPFLQTLLARSPRLDGLWTSHSPTDEGLYALHASRLGCEYDLKHGLGRIPSLSGLLRDKGYATCALSGVTRHFGNKDVFFKRLLRYERCLAEEDLADRPGSRYLGWGLADRSVYSAALEVLEKRRDEPVLVTVETANTHAPYYYSRPEEGFPPAVAATSSRLLRAMHETDLDLMFFYTQLKERKLFDRETLLIITADHSPNHGHEYLELFKSPDFWPDRIPLVFATTDPANCPFSRLRKNLACCQLDLLPTLIEGLGLPRLETVQGRSLFRGEDTPVIREFEGKIRVRHGQTELLVNLAEGGERFDGLKKWYYNSLLQPYRT